MECLLYLVQKNQDDPGFPWSESGAQDRVRARRETEGHLRSGRVALSGEQGGDRAAFNAPFVDEASPHWEHGSE